MTMLPLASSVLRQIISRTRELLLDFDGPVCSVFAGMPADAVAKQFRCHLAASGITLPGETYSVSDPLEVFRAVAAVGRGASERAQRELTALEVKAVKTARPTNGATALITAARQSGRRVTIVSNNSGQAIAAYLNANGLACHVTAVIGRDDPDPTHMKPSSYQVRKALRILGAPSEESVLIGDSASDIAAAHTSEVAVIGYANKPGKAERLSLAGADVTVTRLADITAVLSTAALKA